MSLKITSYIPLSGLSLASYKGVELIEKVGEDIIKNVVISVLCGGNVRSLTEGLTRRRIALSNAALLVTLIKSSENIDDFVARFPQLVKNELSDSKLEKDKKIFLQWFSGLTNKSIQNVLRGNNEEYESYFSDLEESLQKVTQECINDYGEISGTIKLDNIDCAVDWPFIQYLFTAIGTQTLALRGSEKSMYGKLFEKLILGALLRILDFNLVQPSESSILNDVFWLSSRGKKRESDATLLYRPGVGARFDIGFIGPGNTEISLDKVSRFEREYEHGRQTYYMSTIILVDRIGEGSRIVEMAEAIDGNIVQMSMTYWVKEVAEILSRKLNFKHKILTLSNTETIYYIKKKMNQIPIDSFL